MVIIIIVKTMDDAHSDRGREDEFKGHTGSKTARVPACISTPSNGSIALAAKRGKHIVVAACYPVFEVVGALARERKALWQYGHYVESGLMTYRAFLQSSWARS